MDSYNPFTSSEDPFEEDSNKNTIEQSKNEFSFSLLRPLVAYVFLIVLAIGIVSIFMRPAPDIVVVVENNDDKKNYEQEVVNQTTVPSTTSTTTTTPTTTVPKNIITTPVATYNQEEILKKTVQIVVNDCLSKDQKSTSFNSHILASIHAFFFYDIILSAYLLIRIRYKFKGK